MYAGLLGVGVVGGALYGAVDAVKKATKREEMGEEQFYSKTQLACFGALRGGVVFGYMAAIAPVAVPVAVISFVLFKGPIRPF